MWVGIIFKIIYAVTLWYGILSPLKEKRSPKVYFLIPLVILAFIAGEFLLTGFYDSFSFSHVLHHPSLRFWLSIVIYLVITLVELAIYLTRDSFRMERLRREQMESQLTTELNFLHAQINPHFLFNTLNNLFSVAQRDGNNGLAQSISMLSGLMRYMLYDSKVTRVPLQREIDQLRDFVGLASMRFSKEEVNFTFDVAGEVQSATIAPMILLPFIENAFKHGVSIEEKSTINASIKVDHDKILFSCVNSKNNIQRSPDSSGIGLENVKRRLQLLYPGKHNLQIRDNDYFTVELSLQL